MKKTFPMIAGLLFAGSSVSCGHTDLNYVRSSQWVWDSGYKIGDGDFVDFDSDFYILSHDTIYRKGIPKCVVIKTDKKGYQMVVKSLDGQIGYYDDTQELTK